MRRTSVICVALLWTSTALAAGDWQRSQWQTVLRNEHIEAKFQAGQLYELTDRATNHRLIQIDAKELPSDISLFGEKHRIDLNTCKVRHQLKKGSIETRFSAPDGTQWSTRWSLAADGDLVLTASAQAPTAQEEFRVLVSGCDISQHAIVWVHAYGVSHTATGPWQESFLGDPLKDGSPLVFPQPVVALFEGKQSGWFVEGRDERIGPACVMAKGNGDRATLGFIRRFGIPTNRPEMYEIRIRTYDKSWTNAVEPYVKWLEEGAKLTPISSITGPSSWVRQISTQAYVEIGDFEGLESLAKQLDPSKTFVGRQDGFRGLPMGKRYPDYRLTPVAKRWVARCRELGFHVGLHFNCNAVTTDFPDLVERFKPGFAVTGKDANGNDTYESLLDGYFIRCSPAYKPWRDYLIDQMQEAVDCGVDVIYLDEGMGPSGKFVVDGVDGFQGMLRLMQEIQDRYPHVAIETEQVNTLTAKHAKFALSQMPLGHPLSGFIFQKFVKVVPEGVMYSPIETELMDAFDTWGGMLPGADANRQETWLQIAKAYQQYDLVPDYTLPRKQATKFVSHWTHGAIPGDQSIPPGGDRLFGLRGRDRITAFFEKHPTQRGLVIYEPGQPPRWIGTRHYNIRRWDGPGVPSYFGFRNYMRDWLIYDDKSLLGLDPAMTYMFDETVARSPIRFHVTSVPDDFVGYSDMERRISPQEVGREDSFFRLVFAGHGEITMHVPDEYDVFLDGRRVDVNRAKQSAHETISASLPKAGSLGYFIQYAPKESSKSSVERPSMLLAFRRTDLELVGRLVDLPWQQSKDTAKWVQPNNENGFIMNVGAFVIFNGKLPAAKSIRLEGSYLVSAFSGFPADGVVLINGKEALRVPFGAAPYIPQAFNADLSAFSGQHVLMEFIPDGSVRAATGSWINPRISVGQ